MSDKPLVNAPTDPLPAPMSDEPVTDPGTKNNYPVAGADDVIRDEVKTHFPIEGAE